MLWQDTAHMSNITSDCQESLLKILPYMVKIKLSWNAVC